MKQRYINSSSIIIELNISNLTDIHKNITDNCRDYFVSDINPYIPSINETSRFSQRNIQIAISKSAYPYVVYKIPLTVHIKVNNATVVPERCWVYIDVYNKTSIFKGYEITLNSLLLNRNSSGMVNDATLNTTIFLLKQEGGYPTDFMSNMLILLTLILFAFYVGDFGVYYIIDFTRDSETIQKQLDEVQKVILSNGPVLYTLSLPFIVYFLSQKPQISLPTANNIPIFVGLLMTMYLFTHFIAIALRNWYKEADFHFSYHVANCIALLLMNDSSNTYHTRYPHDITNKNSYSNLLLPTLKKRCLFNCILPNNQKRSTSNQKSGLCAINGASKGFIPSQGFKY